MSRALPRQLLTTFRPLTTSPSPLLSRSLNSDENSGSSPSGYPHAYYQYADEHITLSCNDADQYLEFPLENGYGFTGGSPGAYRAIFTEDGEFCAVVYHESRSDNSFAQCDY